MVPYEIRPFPAVNAVIRNAQSQILLTRRSQSVRAPGYWCLPGGHLDPGETWFEACCREVKEEVGLVVQGGVLLGIYSDPSLNVVEHPAVPNGKGQFLTAVFLFENYQGDVTPNHEVDAWGWYPPDQAPQPLLSSHGIRLQDAQQFRSAAFFR